MILVLGGTAEARALASVLDQRDIPFVSSLAGRVRNPRLPPGKVRIGGFGGPERLAQWLEDHDVDAVIDASHPFAERISASARQACRQTGIAALRLERPSWTERVGDRWQRVGDLGAAAGLVEQLGTRVLLTTGRQGLAAFAAVEQAWLLIRCVDPPDGPFPPRHELLLDRGPYTLAAERSLIDRQRIDLVVTKDSGGPLTRAKLDAARERGLPVIVVDRPARPNVPTVATVEEALSWSLERHG